MQVPIQNMVKYILGPLKYTSALFCLLFLEVTIICQPFHQPSISIKRAHFSYECRFGSFFMYIRRKNEMTFVGKMRAKNVDEIDGSKVHNVKLQQIIVN